MSGCLQLLVSGSRLDPRRQSWHSLFILKDNHLTKTHRLVQLLIQAN